MAATKADLEADSQRYSAALEQMHSAHRDGRIAEALAVAISALNYVDGMMQFERRFEGRTDRNSVEIIDYAFRYAPLTFDYQALKLIASLLKSQKRIDKNTTTDLRECLASAERLMWDAHRLWTHLERVEQEHQDKLRTILGGEQDRWRWIAEQWESIGCLRRTPDRGSYLISLTTRIATSIKAKCGSCGVVAKAAMGRFLEENICPKCRAKGFFVFVTSGNE